LETKNILVILWEISTNMLKEITWKLKRSLKILMGKNPYK